MLTFTAGILCGFLAYRLFAAPMGSMTFSWKLRRYAEPIALLLALGTAVLITYWMFTHAEGGRWRAPASFVHIAVTQYILGLISGGILAYSVTSSVALVAVLGLAIVSLLLPHFDRLIRSLHQFKISDFEVIISNPQQQRHSVELNRRIGALKHLKSFGDFDVIKNSVDSDSFFFHELAKKTGDSRFEDRARAAKAFPDGLYRHFWHPFVTCMNAALSIGADSTILRNESRYVAQPYGRAIRAAFKGDDWGANLEFRNAREALKQFLNKYRWVPDYVPAGSPLKKQNPCDCGAVDGEKIDFFKLATNGAWTYLIFAALTYYQDERFETIELLESIVNRFPYELNLYNFLAQFWRDEFPSLERSAAVYRDLQATAKTMQEVAKESMKLAGSSEKSDQSSPANILAERSRIALAVGQFGWADAVFRGGGSAQDRDEALNLIRNAVEVLQKQQGYAIDVLNSYAIALLVVGVERSIPGYVGCAGRILESLEAKLRLRADMKLKELTKGTADDFRLEMLQLRDTHDVIRGDLYLARLHANQLGTSQMDCDVKFVLEKVDFTAVTQ